jgi:hypothetical protein
MEPRTLTVAKNERTTKAEVSGIVTQEQIATRPINSRQYLSLALLVPGTTVDATWRIDRGIRIIAHPCRRAPRSSGRDEQHRESEPA